MLHDIRDSEGALSGIIITKLDRLTRSLRDVCSISDEILEPYGVNLVAIQDGINTFEIASKVLLPFLALIGQIERQNQSERIKATIQHVRSQGGHHGKVPFGKLPIRDGKLKRLIDHPDEKPWLMKMEEWYRAGIRYTEIARRLNAAGVKPRYSPCWTIHSVYELLRTHGIHTTRTIMSCLVYDKPRAYKLAYQLRSERRTLAHIAEQLAEAGLRPKNSSHYTVSSVTDLLASAVYHNRATPRGYALYLREQGFSLRGIAKRLMETSHRPKRGGQWHAHQVSMLMMS